MECFNYDGLVRWARVSCCGWYYWLDVLNCAYIGFAINLYDNCFFFDWCSWMDSFVMVGFLDQLC